VASTHPSPPHRWQRAGRGVGSGVPWGGGVYRPLPLQRGHFVSCELLIVPPNLTRGVAYPSQALRFFTRLARRARGRRRSATGASPGSCSGPPRRRGSIRLPSRDTPSGRGSRRRRRGRGMGSTRSCGRRSTARSALARTYIRHGACSTSLAERRRHGWLRDAGASFW
jgi:hypothetical protein